MLAATVVVMFMHGSACCGQSTSDPMPLADHYRKVAAAYEFRQRGDDQPLAFVPQPIHKYAHPSGLEGTTGSLFIWTRQGRPAVVGSIWSYHHGHDKRSVVHEFHSLAEQPLEAVRVGTHQWHPKAAGVTFLPLEGAPEVSSNRRGRLIQMRAIAKRFTGYSVLEEQAVRLRMLEHPVYRQPAPGVDQERNGVTEGALFVLFNEWDPEILLAIDSRPVSTGVRWHFAAARFNVAPQRLEFDDKTVWEVGQGSQQGARFGDPTGAFFAVHGVELLNREGADQ